MFTFIKNYKKVMFSFVKNEFGPEMSNQNDINQNKKEADKSSIDYGMSTRDILKSLGAFKSEEKEQAPGSEDLLKKFDIENDFLYKRLKNEKKEVTNDSSNVLRDFKSNLEKTIPGVKTESRKFGPKDLISNNVVEIKSNGVTIEGGVAKVEEVKSDGVTVEGGVAKVEKPVVKAESVGEELESTQTEKILKLVEKDSQLTYNPENGRVTFTYKTSGGEVKSRYFTAANPENAKFVEEGALNTWKQAKIDAWEAKVSKPGKQKTDFVDPDGREEIPTEEPTNGEKISAGLKEAYEGLKGVVVDTEDGLSNIIGIDLIDDDVKTEINCGLENDKTITIEYDRHSGDVSIDTEWLDNVIDFKVDNVDDVNKITPEKIEEYIAEYNKRAAEGSLFDKTVKGVKDAYNTSVEWTKETYEQAADWIEETLGEPDMGTFPGANGKKVTIEFDRETGMISADTSMFDAVDDYEIEVMQELIGSKENVTKDDVKTLFEKRLGEFEKGYNEKVLEKTAEVVKNSDKKEYWTIDQIDNLAKEGDKLNVKLIRRVDSEGKFIGNFVNISTSVGDKIGDRETDQSLSENFTQAELKDAIAKAEAEYKKLYAQKNS